MYWRKAEGLPVVFVKWMTERKKGKTGWLRYSAETFTEISI